jgi:hypothetical protein
MTFGYSLTILTYISPNKGFAHSKRITCYAIFVGYSLAVLMQTSFIYITRV